MKLSPLQLLDYFVHSLHVEALQTFDPNKPQELDLESLEVQESCFPVSEDDPNRFAVDLVIKQPEVKGKNLPYAYELHMVAFVEAHPEFPKYALLKMVETNGPSILFGAAREILRTATGRGPYGPVMIPSATFYKPDGKAAQKLKRAVGNKEKAKKA